MMATEKRLIDANELLAKHTCDVYGAYDDSCMVQAVFVPYIKGAPTVDAVEVVHGEWSTIEDDYTGLVALQCSVCNQEYWFEDEPPIKIYNYCPNCGANMRGSE